MKKNQLSSFDILALVKELRSMLIGGFIDKTYQPSRDDITIKITVPVEQPDNENENGPDGYEAPKYKQIKLIIKLGKYLFALERSLENDFNTGSVKRQPGSFAMLLRKHLKNGKITNIFQHEFDRIIVLEIMKKEQYQLVIELFGDGNIALVKDGRIVQPLKTQSWSYRSIRAGYEFKFPPVRINPLKLTEGEFSNILNRSKKDLVRALVMEMDIPGAYAEELCETLEIDKNIKANQVPQDDCIKLFELFQSIVSTIQHEQQAVLVFKNDEMTELIDVLPIPLKKYDNPCLKEIKDFNYGVWQYFVAPIDLPDADDKTSAQAKEKLSEPSSKLTRERDRLNRQLEQQKAAIQKFGKEITNYRQVGEAIYSNYQRCEEVLNQIADLKTRFEPDELFEQFSENDDIVELNPHEGYVTLAVQNPNSDNTTDKLELKLDLRKSVMENANGYYNRGKLAKEKMRGAERALVVTQEKISKLKSQVKLEKKPELKRKIIKHFWFEKFHWFFTAKGNIVVGGRDAKSNDQVVKKYLKDKDRYCHADMGGAASVVVKHDPDENEIDEKSLEEACNFAIIYSKAWSAGHGAGTAYWVKPDQVSKTPQSGEFLARGAFVVRGKRNHITGLKLELGVGEFEYQHKFKLMVGPAETVKKYSKRYIIVVPGDVKKTTTANELSKLFNVTVDDILGLLPAGKFKILDKVGF